MAESDLESSGILDMPQQLVDFLSVNLANDAATMKLFTESWALVIVVLMTMGTAIIWYRAYLPWMRGLKYNDWREQKGVGWAFLIGVLLFNSSWILNKVVNWVFYLAGY